jgi:hypothetical protein
MVLLRNNFLSSIKPNEGKQTKVVDHLTPVVNTTNIVAKGIK